MAANQPLWPREWLMTDERMGERLWEAIDALPAGAGIVFRHYATPEREAIAARVAEDCQARGLALAIAGDVGLAKMLGAQLVHNPTGRAGGLPFSQAAHSKEEAVAAWRAGASLIFLSPLFSTRSHPGALPMSREDARGIVATCLVPVIALGGMNRARFGRLRGDGFYGWAGIDGWLAPRQRPSRE